MNRACPPGWSASCWGTLGKYSFIQIPQEKLGFFLTCYFLCFCLVMAGMKSIIAQKLSRILRKKFPQLEKLL